MATPMPQPGDGLFEKIVGGALTIVSILLGWLFKSVNTKIDDVKKTAEAALPREDFERARAESIADRNDLRTNIKELFQRDDRMKDLLHDEFTKLAAMINTQAENLRLTLDNKVDRLTAELGRIADRRNTPR